MGTKKFCDRCGSTPATFNLFIADTEGTATIQEDFDLCEACNTWLVKEIERHGHAEPRT